MKRWTLRIALILILGSVTTVAVAWGIAWSADFQPVATVRGFTESKFTHRSGEELTEWLNIMRWDSPGSVRLCINRLRETHSRRMEMTYPKPPPSAESVLPDWVRTRPAIWNFDSQGLQMDYASQLFRADGWPRSALMGRAEVIGGPSAAREWRVIDGLELATPPGSRATHFLPLRPIWPGFLVNTLFYSAIWFVLFFGFASARRTIRRRRGRCPKCNYDLRGELDAGCSECGWNRSEPRP